MLCSLRSTGFLQGWNFTVAHGQPCLWQQIGALDPVKDFLSGLIESALRLFGPAAPVRNLQLSLPASAVLAQVHNYFEEQKLSPRQRPPVRDYLSKHTQWMGSFMALDHIEGEALRYCQFVHSGVSVRHRVQDPRGNPHDPPRTCVCEEPVALKVCKRKGSKGPQSNVWRKFWCCGQASFSS